MRLLLILLLLYGCANTGTITVYESDPTAPDAEPVLVIQGVPDDGDLAYSHGDLKLEVKQKSEGFDPFGKVWELLKALTGRISEAIDVPIGGG